MLSKPISPLTFVQHLQRLVDVAGRNGEGHVGLGAVFDIVLHVIMSTLMCFFGESGPKLPPIRPAGRAVTRRSEI